MSHRLVTSFTESNYEQYGVEFLSTFRKFWPKSVKLTIYFEGDRLREDEENIEWHWYEEVEGLQEWLDRIKPFPVMNGDTGFYNIQYDARHIRKALIELHGLKTFGGKIYWADADIVTHSKVTEDFLNSILPDDKFSCFCAREGWMYTETGFIGFNSDHPIYESFAKAYREVFFSGVIFTLQGWHDCYGFDLVRKVFKDYDAFVDLAKDLPKGTMHPIVNSILGSVIDHKKGLRKISGSKQSDLVVERSEPYWKNAKAS